MNGSCALGEFSWVLCWLLLCCLVFMSGGCSPGSRPEPGAATATSDPFEAQEKLSIIQTGSADAAAKALFELVPDAKALEGRYEELIRTAKSTSGEMNFVTLKDTSAEYGEPPAKLVSSRDRSTAILWWVSLKFWEMPKGKQKLLLLDRFFTDLDKFVEEQRIASETALELAWGAVFRPGILPDVPLDSLVGLLKKYADGPGLDARKIALDKLLQMLELLSPAAMEDTYRFYKAHTPGARLPDEAEEVIRWSTSFAGCMSRVEYDELPTLTLRQVHDKLKGMHCDGERCPHVFCRIAIERIIGRFRGEPKEVMEIVKSLLDDGLYTHQIGWCVLVPPSGLGAVDAQEVAEYRPLIDVVLAAYEPNLKRSERNRYWATTSALSNYLRALRRSEGADSPAPLVQLQEQCAKLLFGAQGNWERLSASDPVATFGESPLLTIAKEWSWFYPQTQEALKALAKEYVSNKGSYGDLPQATRDKVEKALNDLIAMP